MATPKRAAAKAAQKAKVIQVRVSDGSKIGVELESALNAFLAENPNAVITSAHLDMLDIGGPSQADIIVIYTVIYTG